MPSRVINSAADRDCFIATVLNTKVPFIVDIKKGGLRSLAQNSYLWGVCYATILEFGSEELGGWTNKDLHEYFLGEHFGWLRLDGFGYKRMKPLHRSSTLTKIEFVDFVAFIQQKAAEMGIVIPDPSELTEPNE